MRPAGGAGHDEVQREGVRRELTTAWAALGGDPGLVERVEVTGDAAGVLPSVWPALEVLAAAASASTLAAAVLDGARAGRPPAAVGVDLDHVAVAGRSERHARTGAGGAPTLFDPLSRFFATADGWLRLHANYPWHRARALGVLGLPDDADGAAAPGAADVAAAVRGWRGSDLEHALADAGAVGFAVRTRDQWRAHPQGRAVAALPLATTTGGREARGRGRGFPGRAAEGRAAEGRAAEGLRVLDLTRVIAGPVATRTLAAWGAQVLRVDSPRLPEVPVQVVDTLPGKASALIDLGQPSGSARLEELLAGADVLVQGYRPGALARYGLAAEALAERHPHLSVVTLSAWGPTGPWAGRRGFDSLVQCATGIADAEGTGGRPGVLPAQVLDHATGYLAAAGALLALAGVVSGEPPRAVDLSLVRTAGWLTARPPSGVEHAAAQPGREVDPAPWMVTLGGAAEPVSVVRPPGRAGDLMPRWASTCDYGTSPARWP